MITNCHEGYKRACRFAGCAPEPSKSYDGHEAPGAMVRTAVFALILVISFLPVLAQAPPPSPNTIWHAPREERANTESSSLPRDSSFLDPGKQYPLAELIDLAEQHNPDTRVVWERAKQQANLLGIARSQLYPLITASVLMNDSRSRILFGSAFVQQDFAAAQPALSLFYTLLDFGNRRAQINAEADKLLATNFIFNDTHIRIIFDVSAAYYQLIGAQGEIAAAEATLRNSQTAQEAAEERLKSGLGTLPDVLEARAATAQARYELETTHGGERIARGRLAKALGISPIVTIQVKGLENNPQPEELKEPVETAIQRALQQRPDLLAQMQRVRGTEEDIKRARSNYYPSVSVSASASYPYMWGAQSGTAPSAATHGETWQAELDLRWTIFDGRARDNEVNRARSANHEAIAELDTLRRQAEMEVWTAYSNTQTAIRQQEAAAALLTASEQSYSAATEAYTSGVKSFLDVVSAQRVLAQARSAQVVARTLVLTDVADLLFRTGDLLRVKPGGAKP